MNVVISATMLNLILNYFLINEYGAYGAALVSLITNIFVGVLYYSTTMPLFIKWTDKKTLLVFILSCGVAYLFWQLKSYSLFIFTPIILALFVFISFKYFLTEKEKNLILPLGLKIPFIK